MPRKMNAAALLEEDPTKISDAEKRHQETTSKLGPQDKVSSISKKMSFSERESLKREVQSMERQFEAQLKEGRSEDPKIRRQYHYKKMLLSHDDELTFSGNDRALALAELKEIEDVIVPKMPSKNEMWPKNDISAKSQALRHQQAFEKEFDNPDPAVATGGLVKRWQELKRRLEPENPFAQNLDTIRPDRNAGEA